MACHKKTWLWNLEDKHNNQLMKTTTQLMLEEGAKPQRRVCKLERKLVNFTSFNMEDPRYGADDYEVELEPPLMTTYMRQFTIRAPNRCKPLKSKAETPDPQFNRLPKNDFDPQTGVDYKFLDDHMHHVTEQRKKINFFRQLRNQSFFM